MNIMTEQRSTVNNTVISFASASYSL